MDKKILNNYGDKGLPSPFVVMRSGETTVSQRDEAIKDAISQITMVIFETISTIGNIKIDTIEILGDKKCVAIKLDEERAVGSLFDRTEGLVLGNIWRLIEELRGQTTIVVTPKKKTKVKLDLDILEKIKTALNEYLGDFTERVYQNQLKTQNIKIDEFYDEDARRLIFALGKAAGMIIGPSKGNELTDITKKR